MSYQPLIEDRKKYADGYYQTKLEEGLQFQDVVTRELYQCGIVVVGYASKRFQNNEGENMLGAEIKRDGKFRETGNLYIETAEKTHPDNYQYVPSGIHRKDNSWLFVIGDEQTIFIFSTKYLRLLENRYPKVEKTTSRGYLMPVVEANRYCIRKIDLELVSSTRARVYHSCRDGMKGTTRQFRAH
jgi:hypothetical protein